MKTFKQYINEQNDIEEGDTVRTPLGTGWVAQITKDGTYVVSYEGTKEQGQPEHGFSKDDLKLVSKKKKRKIR